MHRRRLWQLLVELGGRLEHDDLVVVLLHKQQHHMDIRDWFADGDVVMTYAEALKKLVGHPLWWWYEFHGRIDEDVRKVAIAEAEGWLKPDGAATPSVPVRTCASC
jgi:hypothetical protein